MKIIKKEYKLDFFTSKLLETYFDPTSICVFDIETLGLNPAHCQVVLATIAHVNEDGLCNLTQFFIESLNEESLLLKSLYEELNKFDTLLTYNGRHFDLPFIKKRAAALDMKDFEIRPYNLDLYLLINGHSDLKGLLRGLKQISIEEYMGISALRQDEISGYESVQLYYDFLKEEDPERKDSLTEQILLHNHDDVLQLYRLLPVIMQTDFHRGMNKLGFPVKGLNGWPDVFLRTSVVSKQSLSISGTYRGPGFNFQAFEDGSRHYTCRFGDDNSFTLTCPLYLLKGNIFMNLRQILGSDEGFTPYGGYVNGFLILAEKNEKRNFLETNMASKKLLEKLMKDNPPPLINL